MGASGQESDSFWASRASRARDWEIYAFDRSERAKNGRRQREWTAVAQTEEGVSWEMARCLREIVAGRVPK